MGKKYSKRWGRMTRSVYVLPARLAVQESLWGTDLQGHVSRCSHEPGKLLAGKSKAPLAFLLRPGHRARRKGRAQDKIEAETAQNDRCKLVGGGGARL